MSVNGEHRGVILELRGLRSRIETQRGPVSPGQRRVLGVPPRADPRRGRRVRVRQVA